MSRPFDYLDKADRCLALAERTTDLKSQQKFFDLAAGWLKLAAAIVSKTAPENPAGAPKSYLH